MRDILLPLTLGILIVGTVPGVTGQEDEAKVRSDEKPDPFDKGCDLLIAKHCFLELAKSTIHSMGGLSREEHRNECGKVPKYHACIQESLSACSEPGTTWAGLRVLEPYVPFLVSIATTVCMEDAEEGRREDLDECHMEEAGACLMGFFYVAAEASTRQICWQAHHTGGCMSAAVKECRNPHVRRMSSMITNQIRLTADVTCVSEPCCNVEIAIESLMLAKHAIESPLATIYKSPILCGTLKYALHGAVQNTVGCSEDVYNGLAGNILHLHVGVKAGCAVDSSDAIPENFILQNLVAVRVITESRFSTPETVCPFYEDATEQLMKAPIDEFSLDTIMNTKMALNHMVGDYCKREEDEDCKTYPAAERMCDVTQAHMCSAMANLPYLLANIEMTGKDVVCQEVHKVAKCVNSKLSGCRIEELPDENFTFWHVLGKVGEFCPLQDILSSSSCGDQRKCQTAMALEKCFTPAPTEADLKAGKACSLMEDTLKCVRSYTDGCVVTLAMVPLAYTVHIHLAQFAPYCMIPKFDLEDPFTDHKLIEGGFMWIESIQFMLTSGNDFKRDFCHNLYMADKTISSLELNPFVVFGITKMHNFGTELFLAMCTQYPEETLMTMSTASMTPDQMANPAGCNVTEAAYCFAIHSSYVLAYQFLSMEDRNLMCSAGVAMVKECMTKSITSCTAERQAIVQNAMQMVDVFAEILCPSDKFAKFYTMKMDGCAPDTAKFCLDWYAEMALSMSAYQTDDTCEKLGMTMSCVQTMTSNCSQTTDLSAVTSSMQEIISMFGQKCLQQATPDLCGIINYGVDLMTAGQSTCTMTEAEACVTLFTEAKSVLEKDLKKLCYFLDKVQTCVRANTAGCSAAEQTTVNNNLQTATASVVAQCANMSFETPNPCNVTVADDMLTCDTQWDGCFSPYDSPASICGNPTAVKACLSLHFRGCPTTLVYEWNQHLEYLSATLGQLAGGVTCDLVATLTTGVVSPTYARNGSCLSGVSVVMDYLLNPTGKEINLCKVFEELHSCLLQNVDKMPAMFRSYYTQVARTIAEQVSVRCTILENLDLVYGAQEPITDWAFLNMTGCDIQRGIAGVSTHLQVSLYAGLLALDYKQYGCGIGADQLKDIHNSTAGCPDLVKARVMRVLDWSNSIATNLGTCSYEVPRECDPRKAMACVTKLATGFLHNGHGELNEAVCAGILPTKMCVIHYTSACSDSVRLSVEYSFADMSNVVMTVCKDKERKKDTCDAKRECDFGKSRECLMEMAEKAWSVVEGKGDREEVCRKVKKQTECVLENIAGCSDSEKQRMQFHGDMVKTLVESVCFQGGEEKKSERKDEPTMCAVLAGHCINDFMRISMDGSLTGSCAQGPATLGCLMAALKGDCRPKQSKIIRLAAGYISMAGEHLCSYEGCNEELGVVCMKEATKLIEIAADRLGDSRITCSGLKMALSCASNHIEHCDKTQTMLTRSHLKVTHVIAEKLCGDQEDMEMKSLQTNILDAAGLMSLAVMTTNPLSGKDHICPQAIMIATAVEKLKMHLSPKELEEVHDQLYLPHKIIGDVCHKEEDKRPTGIEPQCNETAAIQCIYEANLVGEIGASCFYGWDGPCRAVRKLTCCVAQKTSKCQSVTMAAQIISDAVSLVEDHCPPDVLYKDFYEECKMPTVQSCRVIEAGYCFPNVDASNRAEVCSSVPSIVECVRKNIAGCSSIQVSPLAVYINQFSNWIQPCTSLVAIDWGVWISDDLSVLSWCSYSYVDGLILELNTTRNFLSSVCWLAEQHEKCIEHQQKVIPQYLWYIFESNLRTYHEYVELCEDLPADKVGQCPNVTAMGTCWEECSEDKKCRGRMKCCSNGCGHTCQMPTGVAVIREPDTCKVSKAATCASVYMVMINMWNILPIDQRGPLCSQYWHMLDCVTTALDTCSDERKAIFMEAHSQVVKMLDEACEDPIIETLLEMPDLCVPDVATGCINELGKYVAMAPVGSEEHVCKKVHKTMECLQRSLATCSENVTMGMLHSMEPLMTMIGNSCPLASAIRCNLTAWNDVMQHATCNESAVWEGYEYFGHVVTTMGDNQTAVCKAFEEISMHQYLQTLLCEHPDKMAEHTWSLTMATYGRNCLATGHLSDWFMKAMESKETCLKQPQCSADIAKCFFDGEDFLKLDVQELCRRKEEVLMCINEKYTGCDELYRRGAMGGLKLSLKLMNVTCDMIGAINANMTALVDVTDGAPDQCFVDLMDRGLHWLYAPRNWDDEGICELFRNFTDCVNLYLDYVPPFWQGFFKRLNWHTAVYTKVRCEITEATRDMLAEDVWKMPGVEDIVEKMLAELAKQNVNVTIDRSKLDPMDVLRQVMRMYMDAFSAMPHMAKEPDSCQRHTANTCMAYTLMGTVYLGYNPIADRKVACRDAYGAYQCVLKSTKDCHPMTRVRYIHMLEWLGRLGMTSRICPMEDDDEMEQPECEEDEAMDCLRDLSVTIVALHATDSRDGVCSKLQPTALCVLKKTWGCKPRIRKIVETSYYDLETIALGLCKPHSDRKKIEWEMKEALDVGDPSECDMEWDDRSRSCDVTEAMFCVSFIRTKLEDMDSHEEMCGAMGRMKACAKRHLSGCMERQGDGVRAVMKHLAEKLKCRSLECDVCGARSCMKHLHEAMEDREASCVDVWEAQKCVKKHLKHCDHEQSDNVTRAMEWLLKNVTKSVCEYPTVSVNDCTKGLGWVAKEILGLGMGLEDFMDMSMEDDKDDDGKDDDKKPYDDAGGKDSGTTGNGTKVNGTSPVIKDADSSLLDDKQMAFMENLLTLVGVSRPGDPCKLPKRDDNSMESLCTYAWMAYQCVNSHLYQVPDDMRPIANTSLHLISAAITQKCTVDKEKKLLCFSCKGAHSNEECNAQPPQWCSGDRQACYTMIDGGVISKGCGYRMPLQKTSQCVKNGTKCLHVCDKSHCNWLEDKALTDPPSCNKRAATLCAMGLVSNLLQSESLDCGVATKALRCVQQYTKDCMSHLEAKMSTLAERALHGKVMMQCYAKEIPCRCGFCSTIYLGRAQRNFYLTREERCGLAESNKGWIMYDMMNEKCSLDEMTGVLADLKLVKHVISDTCYKAPTYIDGDAEGQCNIEGVGKCLELSTLEGMLEEGVQLTDRKHFCSVTYKFILCVHWHIMECDPSTVYYVIASKHDLVMKLKESCDLGRFGDELDYATQLPILSHEITKSLGDKIAFIQSGFGDVVHVMSEVLQTMYTQVTDCKPSTALHQCFAGMETMDPNQYCSALIGAAECVNVLTSGCLWVQKAPVVFLLQKFTSYHPSGCGFQQYLYSYYDEIESDPYAHLAFCMLNMTHTMQEAYARPNGKTHESICWAAIMMDSCIHQAALPRVGKIFVSDLAAFTYHLIDTACEPFGKTPEIEDCADDDSLCRMLSSLPHPAMDNSWMDFPEPDSCNAEGAGVCLAAFGIRIMSSTFLPTDDFVSVCREANDLKPCVDRYASNCSEPRRKYFAYIVDWMKNSVKGGCSMVMDTGEPTCSKAQDCLQDMVGYAITEMDNKNHMCWKVEKTVECVFQHSFACSAVEMAHVHEGLQLVGNFTQHFCPGAVPYICELSMMASPDPAKRCAEPELRSCVDTYYRATWEQPLTDAEYCQHLTIAHSCIMSNVANCHPNFLWDIKQSLMPGVNSRNNDCGIAMPDYKAICPVYGSCSLSTIGGQLSSLFNETFTMKLMGVTEVELCSTVQRGFGAIQENSKECNILEVAMVNTQLDNFNTVLGLACNTPHVSGIQDQDPTMVEVKNCYELYYSHVIRSVKDPKYGFYDICETAMAFNTCMSAVGVPTERPIQSLIKRLLERHMHSMQSFISESCEHIDIKNQTVQVTPVQAPPECLLDVALSCMAWFTSRATFLPLLKPADQYAICTEMEYFRKYCVLNPAFTNGCPAVQLAQMNLLQFKSEELVMGSGVCHMIDEGEWKREVSQLLSAGSFLNEDGEVDIIQDQLGPMQQAVVDVVREMMGKPKGRDEKDRKDDDDDKKDDDDDKKDDDDDKKDEDDDDECSPRRVVECAKERDAKIKMEDWIRPPYDEYCRKMEEGQDCMKKSLKNCMEWQRKRSMKDYTEDRKWYEMLCDEKKDDRDDDDDDDKKGDSYGKKDDKDDDDKRDEDDDDDDDKAKGDWLDTTYRDGEKGARSKMMERIEEFIDRSDEKRDEWNEDDLERMVAMGMREGADPNCVDVSLYKKHAKCDPQRALKCVIGMKKEILNPYIKHTGLCLKYALAARCYLLTSSCDWAVTNALELLANHTMLLVGDKCPLRFDDDCREDRHRECTAKSVIRCYHKTQKHVAAIMKDMVTTGDEVCMELAAATKCVESLDCDDRVLYRAYQEMNPPLTTLVDMCYKMPMQFCATNTMWKMAGLVLLGKQTMETRAMYKWVKKHMDDSTDGRNTTDPYRNKTGNGNGTQTTPPVDDHSEQEDLVKAMATLEILLGGRDGCREGDGGIDGDMATGLKYLVRYAFMFEELTERDEQFMNTMTSAIAGNLRNAFKRGLQAKWEALGYLIEYVIGQMDKKDNMTRPDTNTTKPGHNSTTPVRSDRRKREAHGNGGTTDSWGKNDTEDDNKTRPMDWRQKDIIGKIVVQLLIYGDSDTFLNAELHNIVKVKMTQSLERAAKRGNNLDLEKEDEEAMDRLDGLPHDDLEKKSNEAFKQVLKGVFDMVKYEKANMSAEEGAKLLHMALDYQAFRKEELCGDLFNARHCTAATIPSLPESTRAVVSKTLDSLYGVVDHICEDLKCYSCEGLHDNDDCNEQGKETCKFGQVCYTHIDKNGEIEKGCGAPFKEDSYGEEVYVSCLGQKCNQPKYVAIKEKDEETCAPLKTIGCMYDLLPTLLQGAMPDHRELYKGFACMKYHTSSCVLEDNRELSDLVDKMRSALFDGQCSGIEGEYVCGIRSVLSLTELMQTPGASRATICSTFDDTVNLVKMSSYYGQCTDYEILLAHQDLALIYGILGEDFCPGVDPREPQLCLDMRAKLPQMCEPVDDVVDECFEELEVMMEMGKILGEAAEWRDLDYFCGRLQHGLDCMINRTSSCGEADIKALHGAVTARIGDAVKVCPLIIMNFQTCDPTPLSGSGCQVTEAINNCLKPRDIATNPSILCHLNKTMLDDTMTCIHAHTKKCTAVQGLPISYVMQAYMAGTMLLCGNHSMAKDISSGKVSGDQSIAMETMMHMMIGKALDTKGNEKMPMTNLMDILLSLKSVVTKTGEVTDMLEKLMDDDDEKDKDGSEKNGTVTDKPDNLKHMMKVSMSVAKYVMGTYVEPMLQFDPTHGLAWCIGQFTRRSQRALLHVKPVFYLSCEAMEAYQECLGELDLPPAMKMTVMKSANQIATYREKGCKEDYMRGIKELGRDINDQTSAFADLIRATIVHSNRTGVYLNTSILPFLPEWQRDMIMALYKLLGNQTIGNLTHGSLRNVSDSNLKAMVNGVVKAFEHYITGANLGDWLSQTGDLASKQGVPDTCNTWGITEQLTYAFTTILIIPFHVYSEYPHICKTLATQYALVKPEIAKCPSDYQFMYNQELSLLHNLTKDICDTPYMQATPPTMCNANQAVKCMQDLVPYLSSAGTARARLCGKVEEAGICVNYNLRNCVDAEKIPAYFAWESIKTTMGDSCPYITAAMKCFDNTDLENGQKTLCDTEMASSGCGALVKGSTDFEKCSKLPDMMNCMYRNTYSCSALDMHRAYSYQQVALGPVMDMCNRDDMIAQYSTGSRQCAKAEQCTLSVISTACLPYYPTSTVGSCSDFAGYRNCLSALTKGCSGMQLLTLYAPLIVLLPEEALPCIDVATLTSMSDIEVSVVRETMKCVASYIKSMTNALTDATTAQVEACKALENLGNCFVGDATEEQKATMLAFLGTSFNVTWSLLHELCLPETYTADMADTYDSKDMDKPAAGSGDGPNCDIHSAASYLSGYSIISMFSSLLSPQDKVDFCNPDGQLNLMVKQIYMFSDNCSDTTKLPLHGVGATLYAGNHLSGVCSKELWVCDHSSGLDCALRASRKVLADVPPEDYEKHMCSIFDKSMECLRRNSFDCPKDVVRGIIQKVETEFCIGYDMIKNCPSVREALAMETSELPSCTEEEKEEPRYDNTTGVRATDDGKEAVCDLAAAFDCLINTLAYLGHPMTQCNMMNRIYTEDILCMAKKTSGCDGVISKVVEVVVRGVVMKVQKHCPQVVEKPCQESDSCRVDEAQHCIGVLTYFSEMSEISDPHLCLIRETTEVCLQDKLEHCSLFAHGSMMYALKEATPGRNLNCKTDLVACINKFYYSSMGVIQNDVGMAKIERMKGEMAADVTSYFMDNLYMSHSLSAIDKRIRASNMSKEIQDILSGKMDTSLIPHDLLVQDPSLAHVIGGMTYMWNVINGDDDYRKHHFKMKVLLCTSIREALACMTHDMNDAGWNYLSQARLSFIGGNIERLTSITEEVCREDTICHFMEEPETCHIVPAMWIASASVIHIFKVENDTTELCSTLPKAMSHITSLTSACSDDTAEHFKEFADLHQEAINSICKSPSTCAMNEANACLRMLTAENFCNEYDNVKTCVDNAVKGCAYSAVDNMKARLEDKKTEYGQSCVPMPKFNVTDAARPLRLVEGSFSASNIEVSMLEPPYCGADCYISVFLILSQDNGAPKCSGQPIPQVLAVKTSDTNPCVMAFTDSNFNIKQVVPLVPTSDLKKDSSQTVSAILMASKYLDGAIVKQTQLAEYQVIVVNKDETRVCMASGDNVVSFDKLRHSNYYQQLFVLYRHTTLPQEVLVFKQLKTARKFGTVICAVVIKSGDDIFFMDRCRTSSGSYGYTQGLFLRGSQLTANTRIYNKGKRYKVMLPTGTLVTVDDKTTSLKVSVKAAPHDFDQTTGLCGVYDGDADNDFTLPDGDALAIPNKASSFQATAMDFDRQWIVSTSEWNTYSSAYPMGSFCTCGAQTTTVLSPAGCVPQSTVVETCAVKISGTDITAAMLAGAVTITDQDQCNARKKRQATGMGLFDGVAVDPAFDETLTVPTWDPPRTYTEAMAMTYCDTHVQNSHVLGLCEQIPSTALDGARDTSYLACIDSIKNTDTVDSATSTLDGFLDICKEEATPYLSSTDTVLKDLAEEILDIVCPNSCSNHGTCNGGTCQCYQDWLGEDCSIDESLPPTVTQVENNGLCPLDSMECSSITVLGNNFVADTSLTCHFQAVQIDQSGVTNVGSEQNVPAEFVTVTQVNCPVPAAMRSSPLKWGVKVAISNDGTVKGPYSTFVTYDSNCYTCSVTTCLTAATGCVIDNACHEMYANKPGDVCHFCDPSLIATDWTRKLAPPTCDLPTTEAPPTTSAPTTPQPTTPQPTTPRPTTPAPTPAPTTPVTTEKAPLLSQDAQLIVVVIGVVAGLFAILSCILAVKYCQRKPDSIRDTSRMGSSSGPGSIEDRSKEFENLAYDNFEKKPGAGGLSSFNPPSPRSLGTAQAYPTENIVDMSGMDNDPKTKL